MKKVSRRSVGLSVSMPVDSIMLLEAIADLKCNSNTSMALELVIEKYYDALLKQQEKEKGG